MKLTYEAGLNALQAYDHGVLSTSSPSAGADAIPVVYAVVDHLYIGIPIDTVKPKVSTRLQREVNLEHDPRATLLIDKWDAEDWIQLWWVRTRLDWIPQPASNIVNQLSDVLATKYPQYANKPFSSVLVFTITDITGWSAAIRSPLRG